MKTEFGKQVEAALGSPDGSKVLEFFHAVERCGKNFIKQGVDSPEERRAIEDDVLGLYDKYAAPFMPAVVGKATRDWFLKIFDSSLVALGS